MIAAATVAQLSQFDEVIDVRTPSEFAEDHIPGAVNFPVLSDVERAHVGTVYKQVSSFEAKKIGAALIARNIARHLEEAFIHQPKTWRPLIYCWRGGKRSGALAHILSEVGWKVSRLEGGYKAYRRQVIADLATLPQPFQIRAVCGPTGSGKSRFLQALATVGAQVLDLEQLAAHRGSVLGNLPDAPQPAQKMFESRIWAALKGFDPAQPVFVEAESKKIGMLRVPEALIDKMWQDSECIQLNVPAHQRVQLLKEDYAHFIADPKLLLEKIDCLKDLHSKAQLGHWQALANSGQWDDFVLDMLEKHYDPAYKRSMFKHYQHLERAVVLQADTISPAGFTKLAQDYLSHAAR